MFSVHSHIVKKLFTILPRFTQLGSEMQNTAMIWNPPLEPTEFNAVQTWYIPSFPRQPLMR
jgi:hypothetical protein